MFENLAGVQRGIEQADCGEFVEHQDVVNRIDRLFQIVRLIRWTTEAASQFEAAVKHIQQDNPRLPGMSLRRSSIALNNWQPSPVLADPQRSKEPANP